MAAGNTAEPGKSEIVIPSDHPALAGHFPGNPIVPGVVVLTHVLEAAGQRGYSVKGVINTKFSSLLLPDETAVIEFKEQRSGIGFVVLRDVTEIARGLLDCTPIGAGG